MTITKSKFICAHHGTAMTEENHGTHLYTYCEACRNGESSKEINEVFRLALEETMKMNGWS